MTIDTRTELKAMANALAHSPQTITGLSGTVGDGRPHGETPPIRLQVMLQGQALAGSPELHQLLHEAIDRLWPVES